MLKTCWIKDKKKPRPQVAVILAGFSKLLKRKLLFRRSDLCSYFSSKIFFFLFNTFAYF